MLNLSRRVGESLHIGDAVVIIKEVRGNSVSLAIEAPRNVLVVRSEIKEDFEKKK